MSYLFISCFFIFIIVGLIFAFHFWFRDLLRELDKKYEVLLICLFLLFFLFLASEALLFISFFWGSFHSLSSPTLGVCFGEGFYLPDVLCLYFLQTHFGVSSLSHPDNAKEACALLTPLHIVPEWYFLCQYAMLKAVPNKNAGFIILFTSILTLFFFGEIRNLTTLCVLPLVNNGFSLSFFFLSFLSYLWIGAQFPQEKFLSYARILTLYYYFLLMCILF
eukprot:UN1711